MSSPRDTLNDATPFEMVSSGRADKTNVRQLDLSGFDSSQATSMHRMFEGFSFSFIESLDLSGLDTSQVTDMSCLFRNCERLESLDLTGLDTSRTTNMISMFEGCKVLKCLDLSGFDASHVNRTKAMFRGCTSLKRWVVSDTWPIRLFGAIPEPKEGGIWWSERDGRLMTIDEIRARGPVADTFTSTH